MKNIAIFIIIASFLSCSNTSEKLKSENIKLNNKINSLKSELDSLKNLPSVQFEKIISKDTSLDSLRNKSKTEYILPTQENELKTSDSILVKEYVDFAEKFPKSYFSMYSINRIKNIELNQRIVKFNQIVGKWKWKALINTFLSFNGHKNEEIEFKKDKFAYFFKDGKLISKEKYKLSRTYYVMPIIEFEKKGIYTVNIKSNGLLTLKPGKSPCEDCGTTIYKKVE
ncbi:hypothetical protein [Tenacibaculum haliotis]|uniref:hypothetical protein n=1 Tax=Tenacibaculum haliotis TaxID=1888914 RepID=UPI0021AE3CF8|nr:hypothetical protein [Tenacibaculum haliotis]MCT4697554.1 hypothetical protein [Tenacibaculum haliotis]